MAATISTRIGSIGRGRKRCRAGGRLSVSIDPVCQPAAPPGLQPPDQAARRSAGAAAAGRPEPRAPSKPPPLPFVESGAERSDDARPMRPAAPEARPERDPVPLRRPDAPPSPADGCRQGVAADHNRSRTSAERVELVALAASTPSIMSATTATAGRPRSVTATVADPSLRRVMERRRPGWRGGLRKAGADRPHPTATRLIRRATSANRMEDSSSGTGPGAELGVGRADGCFCRFCTSTTLTGPCDSEGRDRSKPTGSSAVEWPRVSQAGGTMES